MTNTMLPLVILERLKVTSALRSNRLLMPEVLSGSPRRWLTGPEVSTALRPFYFLVHPDLFGKYPQEQVENDKSLKILKNYVETLVHDKNKPNPKVQGEYLDEKNVYKNRPFCRNYLK